MIILQRVTTINVHFYMKPLSFLQTSNTLLRMCMFAIKLAQQKILGRSGFWACLQFAPSFLDTAFDKWCRITYKCACSLRHGHRTEDKTAYMSFASRVRFDLLRVRVSWILCLWRVASRVCIYVCVHICDCGFEKGQLERWSFAWKCVTLHHPNLLLKMLLQWTDTGTPSPE